MRVAMFKRQKSLETERFLKSINTSNDEDDVSLQITGKLLLNIIEY